MENMTHTVLPGDNMLFQQRDTQSTCILLYSPDSFVREDDSQVSDTDWAAHAIIRGRQDEYEPGMER